jgi:hypothetical protein
LFLVQAGLREEPVDLALGEVLALINQEGGTVLRRVQWETFGKTCENY